MKATQKMRSIQSVIRLVEEYATDLEERHRAFGQSPEEQFVYGQRAL